MRFVKNNKASRFHYYRDPLCLYSSSLYGINRFLIKPSHWVAPFFKNYFNDLLFIPCVLPLVLWIHARFHLRPEKAFPTWQEIFYHTLLWSFLMEWLFPLFWKKGTADTKDIFAYLIGAMGSGLYWTYRSQFRNQEK